MQIMIANTAEAFAPLLNRVAHTPEGLRRLRHELTLSQRAFFWGGNNKWVITPSLIPSALMEHNLRVCKYSGVTNAAPMEPSTRLCRAVLSDATLRGTLRQEVEGGGSRTLSPYAFTSDFSLLMRRLSGRRKMFTSEAVPADSAHWTVQYLDSKLGFRTVMSQLPVRIPEGFVARTLTELANFLEWMYSRQRSAVVKVNFGESGWGLWICRVQEYQSKSAMISALRQVMSSDLVWQGAPYIVEEFIEPDVSIAGGSPSVEMFITEDGVRITYHCGQVLNERGEFLGVEIGKDAVPSPVKTWMEQAGTVIGEKYRLLGYRGYCDVDFVIDKLRILFAVETNPRRTGGTHVYDLARHLFGEKWEDQAYFLSHDSFCYGEKRLNAKILLERTGSLLYPKGTEGCGVVITSINGWEPVMGYVIVATSRDHGLGLQRALFARFGQDWFH